jgi:NADP-dependent 3-hydroxy acid dehydrogenase YdfG
LEHVASIGSKGSPPRSVAMAGRRKRWRSTSPSVRISLYSSIEQRTGSVGIAAALPLFRAAGSGHFVNVSSVSGLNVAPRTAVYSGTKFAVRAISEGLRQEAGSSIRVTIISPGAVQTELAETISSADLKKRVKAFQANAIPPLAIASAIAFAITQPSNVDVNEIVVRPTAQTV